MLRTRGGKHGRKQADAQSRGKNQSELQRAVAAALDARTGHSGNHGETLEALASGGRSARNLRRQRGGSAGKRGAVSKGMCIPRDGARYRQGDSSVSGTYSGNVAEGLETTCGRGAGNSGYKNFYRSLSSSACVGRSGDFTAAGCERRNL